MKEQLAQIDLYITIEDDELSRLLDQAPAALSLDAVVQHTLEEVGVTQPVMLTLMVTDDETIQDMNNQYRQQDKPTDVLSFPLLDTPLIEAPADQLWQPVEGEPSAPFVPPPDQPTNLGDIAISWPTVRRQAAAAGHNPYYELLYLVAHGVLHLVGYDDQTEAGYRAMVQKQQQILAALGAAGMR